MTNIERKEAIKEVLKSVKSGKQDLQNGADEIETINYVYYVEQVKSTLAPVSLDEQSEATVCVHTTGCALGYNCKRDKDGCDEFEPKQTEN